MSLAEGRSTLILRVTSQPCPSHGQYKDPEFSAASLWLVFNLKAIKIVLTGWKNTSDISSLKAFEAENKQYYCQRFTLNATIFSIQILPLKEQ